MISLLWWHFFRYSETLKQFYNIIFFLTCTYFPNYMIIKNVGGFKFFVLEKKQGLYDVFVVSWQGPHYCGVGVDKAFDRNIVDSHYKACWNVGINISGINGEVMPGQVEWLYIIFYVYFSSVMQLIFRLLHCFSHIIDYVKLNLSLSYIMGISSWFSSWHFCWWWVVGYMLQLWGNLAWFN